MEFEQKYRNFIFLLWIISTIFQIGQCLSWESYNGKLLFTNVTATTQQEASRLCEQHNSVLVAPVTESLQNAVISKVLQVHPDDLLSLNNPRFHDFTHLIYPKELELKDTTDIPCSASYLDLFLKYDPNGKLYTRIYDKRDDFNFSIVNFPFLCSNIPASPAYGVYISQLIRYGRACSNYEDFIARGQLLTTRLQHQGYTTPRLKSTFRKFFGRQHDVVGLYEKSASVTTFWAGFTRVVGQQWTSAFYNAANTSLHWKTDHSSLDSGDCLVMEVMPWEIRYMVSDCNAVRPYICHSNNDTGNFQVVGEKTYLSTDYFTVVYAPTESVCMAICSTDVNCTAYSYTAITEDCNVFREVVNADPSDLIVGVNGSDVYNSSACCFSNGTIVPDCCFQNFTALDVNCNLTFSQNFTVGSCVEQNITMVKPSWTFNLTTKTGCIYPDDPVEGNINHIPNADGIILSYSCNWKYDKMPNWNITCGSDYKWTGTPYCSSKVPFRCPVGWEQFQGQCYLVDLPEGNKTFEEVLGACANYNAFPLYLTSLEESEFVDKLLYFLKDFKFWTGGHNLINANFYQLSHSYEALEFWDNWKEFPSMEHGCVALQRMSDGVDNGKFYYNLTSCDARLPYICKMGSAVIGGDCMSSTWCRGHASCVSGVCDCIYTSRKNVKGSYGDVMTYCSYAPVEVGKYEVLNTGLSVPWDVAVEFCKQRVASLFTPLTKDLEDLALTSLWVTYGGGLKSWTGLHTANGQLKWTGFSQFELTKAHPPAWRKRPESTNSTDTCVFVEIAEIGTRLFTTNLCDLKRNAICINFKDDSKPLSDTDNSALTPSHTFNNISETACETECLYLSACLSFAYFKPDKLCLLYKDVSTGININSNWTRKKISSCNTLSAPWNGILNTTNATNSAIGNTIEYSCNYLFKIPQDFISTITCNANGRWSQLPDCIPEVKSCPNGWEQTGTTCYYLSGVKKTWTKAKSSCGAMDSLLLELYSEDEVKFISKMLDVKYNRLYWTGGTDSLIEDYYTWSSNMYREISYAPFYSEPKGGDKINCLSVGRIFNETDTGQFYLRDDMCSEKLRYICYNKVINIGSTGCSVYGKLSCKSNAHCENDTCICDNNYFQIGQDDEVSTACLRIKPIGTGDCLGFDEMCFDNRSICNSNSICKCQAGTYQNGPDNTFSTTCSSSTSPCPDINWYWYNDHCYTVPDIVAVKSDDNIHTPQFICGRQNAHLVTIHSQKDNVFFTTMGRQRSSRWIGLYTDQIDKAEKWADNSDVIYQNRPKDNSTVNICTFIDVVGLWRKASCTDFVKVGDVICERTARCIRPPIIQNTVNSANSSTVYEVGSTFLYSCLSGYVLSGNHNGAITCKEINRRSVWSSLPSCQSLHQEHFSVNPNVSPLYGILISSSSPSDQNLCSDSCFKSDMPCQAFTLSAAMCYLYTDVNSSPANNKTMLSATSFLRNAVCGSVPYSTHSSTNVTGLSPGDTITYMCNINYKINRFNASLLTCLPNGKWNYKAPVCTSRFKRVNGFFIISRNHYFHYKVYTVDTCEELCLKETKFRCVQAIFYSGVCYLQETFMAETRGNYFRVTDGTTAIISELIDSDLEEFDLTYDKLVNNDTDPPDVYFADISQELCAQECLFRNCTLFFVSSASSSCFIYNTIEDELNTLTLTGYKFFKRRYGCSQPPAVANATLTILLQQTVGAYSIGDIVHMECDNPGEEFLNNHDGNMKCQKTGFWSSTPVCKNLCETGWYMKNYTCYKMIDSPTNFWQARNSCLKKNAGLINIGEIKELDIIKAIWYLSGSSSTYVWAGLYSDMHRWKWSEGLGGNVSQIFPGLQDASTNKTVTLQLTDLTVKIISSDENVTYICEKAAGKLVCPAGWVEHFGDCLYLNNDTLHTYNNAQSACKAIGASLVNVSSVFARDTLMTMVDDIGIGRAYVGLHKPINGMYKSDSGARTEYSYYFTKETHFNKERCGVMYSSSYKMESCSDSLPFICQKSITEIGQPEDFSGLPCSTDTFCNDGRLHCAGTKTLNGTYPPACRGKACPHPWKILDGRCYLFTEKEDTMVENARMCNKKGGYLFVPNTMYELYRIFYWMRSNHESVDSVYVGINKYTGGDYIAADTRLNAKELSRFSGDCMYLNLQLKNMGLYGGIGCHEKKFAVCEKSPLPSNKSDYLYEGCYLDSSVTEEQELGMYSWTSSSMTVDICVNHCKEHNVKYAALRNGDICGCGNSRGNYKRGLHSDCGSPCIGNSSEICGGPTHSSVYRTSGDACSQTIPHSPMDPQVCYSFELASLNHLAGRYDCLLQGGEMGHGYLVSIENPVIEESLYNQLLLNTLRFNSSEIVAFIGLKQNGNNFHKWASGFEADWLQIINENGLNFWKFGTVLNMSMNGQWREEYTFTQIYSYVCQLQDMYREVKGNQWQRQYTPTTSVQTHLEGNFHLGLKYDFGCLLNRFVCPEGFMLHFWLRLKNSIDIQILFSSGDCVTDIMGSFGFCLFYIPKQQSLIAIDIQQEVIKQTEVEVTTNTWINILIYFDENSEIFVFKDGCYASKLEKSDTLMFHTRNVATDEEFMYEEDAEIITNVRNLTFTAAPPDAHFLTAIQDLSQDTSWLNKSTSNLTSPDQSWSHFQHWGMNISEWSGAGVDGNGLRIPYKSFTFHLGEFPIQYATHLLAGNIQFSFSIWIKIPFNIRETIDIIRHGAGIDSDPGILVYYNAKSQRLVFSVMLMIQWFETSYNAPVGHWQHYGLVFDNAMKLYVNGQLLELMPKLVKSIIDKGNKNSLILSGSGVCPLGWTKFGLSCYLKSQTVNLDFWQQEHYCRSLNAHLLTIDTEEELMFVKSFLHESGNAFMGVYDIQQDTTKKRLWFNTRGYRHHNLFFSDTSPEKSESENFVSMLWNPNYAGASTRASGSFDTGTNITANSTSNITMTTACEINQVGPRSRQEMEERCIVGWRFWKGNCYRLLNETLRTSDQAELECAKVRSSLVTILSMEEQTFISNWMLSDKINIVHIGLRLTDLPNGNDTHLWSNLRPLQYNSWYPGVVLQDSQKKCAVLSCAKLPCSWYPYQCSTPQKAMCKKIADMRCGLGWRMYKDKCVAMFEDTTGVDENICTAAGTTPLSLRNNADMQEYLYMFGVDSRICMTDGIDNGTSYTWKSTNDLAYFDGFSLSGSGQCIGLDMTSKSYIKKSCSTFTCVICQHYNDVGLEIDNVQMKMQHQTESEIHQTYTKHERKTEVYVWEMETIESNKILGQFNSQRNNIAESSTVYLEVNTGMGIYVDKTMDRVLRAGQARTWGIYNLTQTDTCLSDMIHCRLGITIMFWLKGSNLSQCILVDTKTDGTTGLTLWVDNSGTMLFARLSEQNYYWEGWIWLMSQEWIHIVVTWQKNNGLKFYTNFQLTSTVQNWQRLPPFVPVTNNSTHILVAKCTSDWSSQLSLDNLEILNYDIESENVRQIGSEKDLKKILDFNTIENSSFSNVNVYINASLAAYVWRNSLFYTALHVDNKEGSSPAVNSKQLFHCFTRPDFCIGSFTLSLWLRPLDVDSDQIFLHTGTKYTADIDISSLKLWFKYSTGEYLLDIFSDKTHFIKAFYLDPYKWSHIVIVADLPESRLLLYVNGHVSTTVKFTTTFIVDRVQTQNPFTFLKIGEVGKFEIDDIQHIQKEVLPLEFYVLKSCEEYELAGFRGTQFVLIDTDTLDNTDEAVNTSCTLAGYTPYQFSLDSNETTSRHDVNISLTNLTNPVEGVLGEAIELDSSNLTISIPHVKCFNNVAYCYFGISIAFWVRLKKDVAGNTTVLITLLKIGGHKNASGIAIVCEADRDYVNSVRCTLSFSNGSWCVNLKFHLQYKYWNHLAVTWNRHRGLRFYKNGGSVSDLGAILEASQSLHTAVNISEMSYESICFGWCRQSEDGGLKIAVDDLYLSEIDLEQSEVRKLYGFQHDCWMDKGWRYIDYTDMCYRFSVISATCDTAEQKCQTIGGNLAVEKDIIAHQQLTAVADTVEGSTQYYIALRDRVVLNNRALYWTDGSQPDFTTITLTMPLGDTTGYCSVLKLQSNAWIWDKQVKNQLNEFICQSQPWYIMKHLLYLNSTVISPATSSEVYWTGNIILLRGETPSSILFNNSYVWLKLSDKCVVNTQLCHNGMSITFWFKSLSKVTHNSNEVIMSTMTDENSHGIMVYLHNDGSDVKLVVDFRTSSNFTSAKLPISLRQWTHIALSISNETTLAVFLNGKKASNNALTSNAGKTASRALGEEVDFVVGSNINSSNPALMLFDNMTVYEQQILNVDALDKEVYENFPDFYLPFDDLSLFTLPPSGVTCSQEGWFGNYINFDGTASTQFIGHFYQDCFGFPDFCREGFSLSFWLYPTFLSASQGIISTASSDRGFAVIYYLSHGGLGSHFWIFIRDNSQELRIPFKLELKAWSHIFVSWYVNKTVILFINGLEYDMSSVASVALTSAVVTGVKKLTLGGSIVSFPLSSLYYKGGIDDLIFRPRPLNQTEMLQIYKNSTFIKRPYSNSFDEHIDYTTETCEGVNKNGSRFKSGIHWLNLTSHFNQTNCLLEIDKCVHGFTIDLYVKFLEENDTDQIIFTTGGHLADGLGIALLYTAMNKSMPFRRYFELSVLTASHEYKTWFNMKWGVWNHLTMSFHRLFGIKVFVDGVLSSLRDGGTTRATFPTINRQDLVFGEVSTGGIVKGSFAVDELVVLDRALFEDKIEPELNELWWHWTHRQITASQDLVTLTELTRDECHQKCRNNSCSVFSVCDVSVYGTCYFSTSTNHSEAFDFIGEHNPNCDLFIDTDIPNEVKTFGCYPESEVVNSFTELKSLLLVNNSTCKEACKNISKFHYSAVAKNYSLRCFCGRDEDHDELKPSMNLSCDTSFVMLYQLTGLRDFLNVTVPITDFIVDLLPGNDLRLSAELLVTMSTNELSYSGYSINFGDGTPLFYTNRNSTKHVYDNIGSFKLEISALNEISIAMFSQTINVFEIIRGVKINAERLVATDRSVNVTLRADSGSDVTCFVDFGDGTKSSVEKDNIREPFNVSYIYLQEGEWNVSVFCNNSVSNDTNFMFIQTIHPVTNLQLITQQAVIFGNDMNVTYFATKGSNVSINLTENNNIIFSGIVPTLIVPITQIIQVSQYLDIGQHYVGLSAGSLVSDTISLSDLIYIDIEIENLALNLTKYFFRVNESAELYISVQNGSNFELRITYGDGLQDILLFAGAVSYINRTLIHTFMTDTNFEVMLHANNSVTNVNVSVEINVEHIVSNVDLTITTVVDPMVPVRLTFSSIKPYPTNAVFDLQFGNMQTLSLMPLSFNNSGILEMYHTYLVNGMFNVSVNLHNNVSTKVFTEVIKVGSAIENLRVETAAAVPIGFTSVIKVKISAGSLVTYTVNFGDGSRNVSTVQPVTYPNSLFVVNHTYSAIARYAITVTAVNYFDAVENSSVTIHVMEKITGLIVTPTRTVSKVGWINLFHIQFLSPGTVPCIYLYPGDGTKHVFGRSICMFKSKNTGANYQYLEIGTSVTVSHTYTQPGDFDAVLEAINDVSHERKVYTMRILEFPCVFPKVKIYGFSKNVSQPTSVSSSSVKVIRTIADTFCLPIRNVIFQWKIAYVNGSKLDNATFNLPSLPYLTIPANSLQYGLYTISVLIFIENFSVFNDTSVVYMDVIPSPLVLEITGGHSRTTSLGQNVVLDSMRSYDPDFRIHGNLYKISWYCWNSLSQFDGDSDAGSKYLKPLGNSYCHDGVGSGYVVTLPSAEFTLGMKKTYVAMMSEGNRSIWSYQKILVIQNTNPQLSIKCVDNCGGIISNVQPVKLEGECQTCTWYNRLQLPYKWRLFEVSGQTLTEVNSWQDWTDTGTDTLNLVIQPNKLTAGQTYDLQLESNEAFTVRRMHVSLPPYNGTCNSNVMIGKASSTKFIFSCNNWLDEGSRRIRNLETDMLQPSPLTFTFNFGKTYSNGQYKTIPFFRMTGYSAQAPEMMFDSGSPADGYRVYIDISVTDFYGSSTTVQVPIKVLDSQKSAVELLQGDDLKQCQAEKDMMCMLMLFRKMAYMTNQQTNKVKEAIVQLLVDIEDLIQDEVLAISAVDTLHLIQESTEQLSIKTKDQMVGLYRNQVRSMENSFKETMDTTEKHLLATDLLSGVINFCLAIKFDPNCKTEDCERKKSLGDAAIDLIGVTDNLTRIILEKAVPEENAVSVNLSHGDNRIFIQRKEAINVVNSTLQFEGYLVADIPDLSSVLDMASNQYLDIQTLISENLRTTDESFKSVKIKTTSLSFMNSSGSVIHLDNLTEPVVVRMYPPILLNLEFTSVNLSSELLLVQIKMNETGVIPIMVLKPVKNDTEIRFFMKIDSEPTVDSYDITGVLNQTHSSTEANTYIVKLANERLQHKIQNSTPPSVLYVGLQSLSNDVTSMSPAVSIGLFAVGCNYWHEEDRKWTVKGLSVGKFEKLNMALCKSTHLSTFGMNIFVPPNTIDFKNVWSKFSADNLAVTCTVASVLGLYFFILVFIRRADKKDIQKWATYPLRDNLPSDVYHYHMTVYTGMRSGAGTTSRVFFVISGEDGDTEVRAMMDYTQRALSRGSVNNYLLSVPAPLGNLLVMRIWHDSSGNGTDADWLLNMVLVRDIQNGQRYVFLCDQWLSLEKDDGQVERTLPVACSDELQAFDRMFYNQTRRDLTDGHLWISVMSRPVHSVFTRVQRLSCCLSLLFLTMVTNAMWYGTVENSSQQLVHLGPFTFSAQEFVTSLLGSLIVVPVSLLIITLFKKSKRRKPDKGNGKGVTEEWNSSLANAGSENSNTNTNDARNKYITPNEIDVSLLRKTESCVTWSDFQRKSSCVIENHQAIMRMRQKTRKRQIPFWCLYVAWALVALSVLAAGFFTILYSMEWGSEKSSRWLTSFVLSFIESVILVQPLKLIRYSRVCSNYEDFIARGQLLTTRLQQQGYTTPRLKSTFRKFFGRQHDIVGGKEKSASDDVCCVLGLDLPNLLPDNFSGKDMLFIQVIIVAIVLILIFKSVDDEEDDDEGTIVLQAGVPLQNKLNDIEHRRPYQARFTDLTAMEDLRLYRSRCKRLFFICRQLGAYIVYLVVIAILTYENRNKDAYNAYYNLKHIFLQPQHKRQISFVNISSPESFWNWTHDVLVPGLYADGWYSDDETDNGYLADSVHYRVGTPRLRQARVKQERCDVPTNFKTIFSVCYPDYKYKTYDEGYYSEGWLPPIVNSSSTPWQYQSALDLNGYPVIGTYGSYGGGGFVASLGGTNDSALAMFDYLKTSGWIDRGTRAVIIEANIYNPNMNMFCVLSLVLEFPPTGSIITFPQISPVTLYRYTGVSAVFLLVVDLCFVIFTIYYLVGLVCSLREQRFAFFKEFWNCIDFFNMILSIVACSFYGVHFIAAKLAISDFKKNRDAYLNLQHVVFWEGMFGYSVAFLLFFAMLKLLMLLRFNTKITQLSGTLKKAFGPITSFFVVFTCVFMAFAELGHLVFGKDNWEYSTMLVTFETLMSMLLMKMNIDDLLEVNAVFGMLYLFLFALFVVFILINMLLSIINEAYTDVRKDPSCLPDDPVMAQFFFDQVKKLIIGYTSKKSKNKTDANKQSYMYDVDLDIKMTRFEEGLTRYMMLQYDDRP